MELFHRLEGEGPTLILNHGWVTSQRFFERQGPLAEGFRLLLWDLPGHGDSEKNPGGYLIADCAVALRQLIQDLNIQEAVGIGWSLGAQVLWEYVRQFGEGPFRAFVNVDALPWADPEHFQVAGVRFSFERNRAHAQRKFLSRLVYRPLDEATLRWMEEESLKCPNPIALRIYEDLARSDYREVFSRLKRPVLSLLGRHGFYGHREGKLKALLPGQGLEWFEESGHIPFWEESEKFNETLRRFARELG